MRYRLQRHDGTDCSDTMVPITVLRMVPIQRYRQLGDISYIDWLHQYKNDDITIRNIFLSNYRVAPVY